MRWFCGESNGAVHQQWQLGANYNEFVAQSISYSQFLAIKQVIKLNDNSVDAKHRQPGYNPAYKFDLIYCVIINNINTMMQSAELDLCGNETTWEHGGFGPAGTGLTRQILGKPGKSKCGQIDLVCDVSCCQH